MDLGQQTNSFNLLNFNNFSNMDKKIKLTYDDVSVVPEVITDIETRKSCDPYDEYGMLPIFTAPMNTVVSENNIMDFIKNKINVIIPRTIELNLRIDLGRRFNIFIAMSLDETEEVFLSDTPLYIDGTAIKICIDIANGHMKKVINLIKTLKNKYGNTIIIMAGNIANPKSYEHYEKAGCDYVRCGVGGGSACLTSSNTSVHYPYFSLIEEIYNIKQEIGGKCKIIADGNIRGYRDIQKALIFADYVMIGNLFNRALESAGKTTYGKCYWNFMGYKIIRPIKTLLYYGRKANVKKITVKHKWKNGEIVLWKQYYGMSTKIAQKVINPKAKKLKTSEGLIKYQKVEYTLSGWAENETDYLRSALSYTNSHNLEEYKNSEYVVQLGVRYNL